MWTDKQSEKITLPHPLDAGGKKGRLHKWEYLESQNGTTTTTWSFWTTHQEQTDLPRLFENETFFQEYWIVKILFPGVRSGPGFSVNFHSRYLLLTFDMFNSHNNC